MTTTETNGQPATVIVQTLTFLCDACKKPVTGTRGYICVDKLAAMQSPRLIAEWKQRHPAPAR